MFLSCMSAKADLGGTFTSDESPVTPENLHRKLSPLGLGSISTEPEYSKTDLSTADERAPLHNRISSYESRLA